MGFLEGILKQATGGQGDAGVLGALVSMASRNPQILMAVAGLLSSRDTSIGGSAGLSGLVDAFQKKGLGDVVSGWVSTGPNPSVSASQVTDVLGPETLTQFAARAGVPVGEAGSLLAGLLPAAIDQLTPDGTVPDAGTLESTLISLFSGAGR